MDPLIQNMQYRLSYKTPDKLIKRQKKYIMTEWHKYQKAHVVLMFYIIPNWFEWIISCYGIFKSIVYHVETLIERQINTTEWHKYQILDRGSCSVIIYL